MDWERLGRQLDPDERLKLEGEKSLAVGKTPKWKRVFEHDY